jgi:predicted RNA-binding protein with PIN domain
MPRSEPELDAPQKIVVDGYNVIYADDELRRVAASDIGRSREKLVSILARYLANKDLMVTVVFDGRGGLTDADAAVPGKLQVVYSAKYQTADDLIIAMIKASPNPRSHLVVTSDRAHIRPAVAEIGCAVIESKDFLERIRRRKARSRRRGEEDKPGGGSDDLDYWLKRFERGS